jgi:hypothetical protein
VAENGNNPVRKPTCNQAKALFFTVFTAEIAEKATQRSCANGIDFRKQPAYGYAGSDPLKGKSALLLQVLGSQLKNLVQQRPSVLSAEKMIQDGIRSLWVGLMVAGRQ